MFGDRKESRKKKSQKKKISKEMPICSFLLQRDKCKELSSILSRPKKGKSPIPILILILVHP
jgi:hypothetical protein